MQSYLLCHNICLFQVVNVYIIYILVCFGLSMGAKSLLLMFSITSLAILFSVFHDFPFISIVRWAANSCSMNSLYDMRLISETVPVILDKSETWYRILATSLKLGDQGVAHVQGISRMDFKDDERYANLLLINRTASPLSWYIAIFCLSLHLSNPTYLEENGKFELKLSSNKARF